MFAAGRWKCRILAVGASYQIITVAFYHVTFFTYTSQSITLSVITYNLM